MVLTARGIVAISVLFLLVLYGVTAIGHEHPGEAVNSIFAAENSPNLDREWVTEMTGQFIPLDTEFIDENGEALTLRAFIDRPTLILPIYFYCPNSCSRNLANLAGALNRLNFQPGQDYRVIALSFNESENADNARRAKNNYLKLVNDQFPAAEWKFLTGTQESITAVTDALGYRFKRLDAETFIHPSALITVSAEGKIIRYVYGTFVSGDIDIAIANAESGTPALSVKRLLDFCFNYDPDTNKGLFQKVKIAVLVIFATIIASVFIYFGRKKRR